MKALISVIILNIFCLPSMVQGLQCLTSEGTTIDWFIALKLPKNDTYYYCDSTNSCAQFDRQPFGLNDLSTSPLMRTLSQIQTLTSEEYGTLLWNDENPNGHDNKNCAHSKGVIGFDQETGFVITHSMPKFPAISDLNEIILNINSSQQIYGQHVFCISVSTDTINTLAVGYQVDYDQVYAGNIPLNLQSFENIYDHFRKVRKLVPLQGVVEFQSLGGENFYKFFKSGKLKEDFYEYVVAETLGTGLNCETWGSYELPTCTVDPIFNVYGNNVIRFQDQESYPHTKDHSKYAISNQKYFVCLGDINRQDTQDTRGGGTICFKSILAHQNFQSIMVEWQTCSPSLQSVFHLYDYLKHGYEQLKLQAWNF